MPDPEHYNHVLGGMDMLEGVPDHYDRHKVPVFTPDGIVTAWTYIPVCARDRLLPEVPTNAAGFFDWKENRRAARH